MIGRLRLISGLVLTLFLVGHFINHALGIISLKAMNDALKYFIQPWRDPVGEAALIIALLVHVVLAIHALYVRRSLSMSKKDMAQLVSGFLIPILLGAHVMGTRGIHEVFGVVEGYQFTLYGMWIPSIFYGVMNLIALPVTWVHVCLGWHMWFRLKPWYKPLQPWALGVAIILPTLALAGWASASLRVSRLSNSEKWVERLFARTKEQVPDILQFVATWETIMWISVPVVLISVLILRQGRDNFFGKRSGAKIQYRDLDFQKRRELNLIPETNLLEHLRLAEIDHASVCGGRGRCSTCRVRIDDGVEGIEPAGAQEAKVLERIGAPPNVRLACQLVPKSDISVTALLNTDATPADGFARQKSHEGEEQEIAVLFADIRAFTKLSEAKLPYDTAFLLNRYFSSMGKAIEESGGHLDKFIGDGVMALFGIDESFEEGCKKAVAAAVEMSKRLERLNESLAGDLDEPLRIGIGIHGGTAIVGQMGYNKAIGLTAIGDVVNTASRLETLTKEHVVQMIVSGTVVDASGADLTAFPTEQVQVRGREGKLLVYKVESAARVG